MERKITDRILKDYKNHLIGEEKSEATIKKYMCDVRKLVDFLGDKDITKSQVIEYKEYLKNEKRYKLSSINSFLVAANRLFEYLGWYELRVKTYKIQREIFMPSNIDLQKEEYKRLIVTARKLGRTRIEILLQTICATGIRVSELSAITVHSVKQGIAEIYNKGKMRKILIPRSLQMKLLLYIRKNKIHSGEVFCTSTGKPLDRTRIWREMKMLCEEAEVSKEKVFPHNLRHLFAKCYYQLNKDIAKLADILGHSNIETTRIYIRSSCAEYYRELELMDLLIGDENEQHNDYYVARFHILT